ncbi:MAG: peptidoglycan-binding protein [Thioploca sp.]|nr:peptidoglycan-binding protein [Thioploca sp.]
MRMLTIGSTGPEVKTLQTGLNLLPSELVQLAVDGIFGLKTFERVKEYQVLMKIVVDGIVGRQTWNTMEILLGLLDRIVQTNQSRDKIVSVAKKEAEGQGMLVHAKRRGALDAGKNKYFRAGHTQLLEYFRKAAPDPNNPGKTFFTEDDIAYLSQENQLSPCPSWCGIFALWAYKAANIQVGNWILGCGIDSVQRFKRIHYPQKGDIGYVGGPYQHMVLIERVYLLRGWTMIDTIEGNSEPDSAIQKKKRSKTEILSFYSAFL